jgi:hypothetical protein
MSMSEARCAMPSARMRAPSLTSAYTQRSTISASLIARGVMPCFGAVLGDQLVGHRVGDRVAVARLVAVPAGARLLAEAPELAQLGRRSPPASSQAPSA